MYYLETSSLRKLIPNLQSKTFIKDKSTSLLTLFEIMAGIIDQKTFEERRGMLVKIQKSKLLIDWRLPPEILFEAYGIGPVLANKKPILKIIKLIKNCKTFNTFIIKMDRRGLGFAWWFITLYDEHSTLSLTEAFKKWGQKIYKETSPKEINKTANIDWSTSNETRDRIVASLKEKLAEGLYENEFINVNQQARRQLLKNYNGSIDVFLLCSSYYAMKKYAEGGTPAKNDFQDLNHLFYLKDLSTVMVTDDKLLLTLGKKMLDNQTLPASSILELPR